MWLTQEPPHPSSQVPIRRRLPDNPQLITPSQKRQQLHQLRTGSSWFTLVQTKGKKQSARAANIIMNPKNPKLCSISQRTNFAGAPAHLWLDRAQITLDLALGPIWMHRTGAESGV